MGNMNKLHLGITTALRGAGGAQQETRTPIESPDSLRSIAYARIVDLVSEGEIVGFADQENPMSCVFLNETPVANADGSLNFRNIQVDSRVGTQTQDYLPNFDGVENEIGIGVELRQETPWVRAITNVNLNAIRIRLSTPALAKTNTTNGDTTGHSVAYNIALQTDGGSFVTLLSTAMTGKTSTKYERSHRIELPPATTGWTVRVTRTTPNDETSAVQDTTNIESYAEIVEAKLRMPMSALVSVIVDAEQFNSIPSRAYRLKGRIIRVPSNYDPDTREYSGVWDGTFQPRYSNNPAWIFYDMALNTRYGLGHLVPNELVNKWALYRIAQYCDELVPDGFGGMEPRFTCNVVLQAQNDALRVMQDLATVFRGIIYANGGSITAVSDMPDDPVYTYTPANVLEGKFIYAGSGRKVRHTVALVSWTDLNDFGRAKVEYVDDPEGIARYGIQQTEVIAVGCTSRGQARRWGRYLLATERYETDTVSFNVGLDGTVVAPGKIINIADPLRAGERRGGRIRNSTLNSVEVDMLSVSVVPGNTLIATMPTGVTERRTILSVTGNNIVVDSNFSAAPVIQSVWAVDSEEVPLARYRVLGVAERNDEKSMGYSITAVVHIPGKFAFADSGEPIETTPVADVPPPSVPSPTGLTVTQRDVSDQNTAAKIVNLSWTIVPIAVGYHVKWRQGEASWIDLGVVGFNDIDIPNVNPGPFEVQVVAVNALGVRSQPAFAGPFDITPVSTPPGFVDDIVSGLEVLEEIALENQADIAQEIIDRTAADAAVAAAAASDLASEAATRAADDLAVANAAATALLDAQTELEAAITTESTIRQSADESLSSQIATLSAGTGEQFDSALIYYFDSTLEGWTSGSATVVDGWLTMNATASNPSVISPTLVAPFDPLQYRYVKTRVKKTGTLTWRGWVRWITAGDTTWDSTKQFTIPEPTWDVNGIATLDFKDIPWPAGVTNIRLYLFTDITAGTAYYAHDWIAIGRPSPGASAAALQQEATARIAGDAAEATQRTTLATQMRGAYTGTDIASVSSGLMYSERQARVTADSALASDITVLDSRLDIAEGNITSQASAITALDTRVTSVEGVNTSQASAITSLDSRITSAEGVNTSQGTAITNLTTRVTAAENDIDVLSSDVTSLTAEVATKASSSALTALTTRVTTAEGNITTNSNSITSLNATLGDVGGGNMCKNGGFEVNTTGLGYADAWVASNGSTGSTITYDNSIASDLPNSTKVQQISASAAQTGHFIGLRRECPGVVAGKSYSISAMARKSVYSGSVGFQVIVVWRDAADASLGTVTSTEVATSATAWVRPKREAMVAPAGAVSLSAYVRAYARASGGAQVLTVQFDNVMVVEGNIATNYQEYSGGNEQFNSATASALTSLDARVTTAEGNITSNASSITSLTATLGAAAAQGVTIVAGNTVAGDWVVTSGTGEVLPIATSDTTVMAGRQLQLGNNAGNDLVWLRHKDLIPFDPNKLYRVRVRARVSSASTGAPQWYGGLCAMNAAKTSYVGTTGAETSTLANSHYVAVSQANTAMQEFVGYFKGKVVGARTGSGTITDPWTMPSTVAYIAPMFIGNYNAQTGFTYIDKAVIEDADAEASNAVSAAAITVLEARVTSVEGVNTAQASSITSLNASIGTANANITRLDQVVASAAVGNAVRNPSFEDNLDGWTANAAAYIVTSAANARTGTKLLRLDATPSVGLATMIDYIPVKVGQQVRFSFYGGSYGTAPNAGSFARINVRWYDATKTELVSGGYVATPASMTAPTTRWAQAVGIMTVPAGAVYCRAVITTNSTSGSWGVEDVSVEVLTDGMANAYATSGVTLDVNGYVTGYRQTNTGTTGIFSIVADKFQIVAPGGGARTEFSDGNWRVYDSSGVLRVRMGVW
jgi:predicted phage tail protein/uncharacterized coiled-coil protein SlyX